VNTCIGEGNHIPFVMFLAHMLVAMSTHLYVLVQFLLQTENRSLVNIVSALPFMVHSALMVVYAALLLFSQYGVIFQALTTNEQFNGWRYRYMSKDPRDQTGKKMLTPFDEGKIKNCLSFFRLRKGKRVAATVDMAAPQDTSQAPQISAGGVQLPAAEFDWDGIEFLLRGAIATPETEAQVQYMLQLQSFQEAMKKPGALDAFTRGTAGAIGGAVAPGHSHGGGGGGGHGHSHGGKECHGHGGGGHGHSH